MRVRWGFLLMLGLGLAAAARADEPVVAESAEEIRPVLVGSAVPDASVRTIEGKDIGLREAIAGEPTVLVVYRGGWCPVCDSQLSELRHAVEPLRELGVDLVAVGADTPERLRPTSEKHGTAFRLLSDFDLHAAKALGLAFHVSDEYVGVLDRYGLDTEGNAVSTEQVLPVPAVFVVDPEGTITFSYVNPNYQVRCDPDVLLAAARSVVKGSAPAN